MRIGERVKILREQQGLSQRAFAKKAGLDVSTLNRIERKGNPSLANVYRLAFALGVSAGWLVDPTFTPPSPGAARQECAA